jgi:S1-C subfamily serine protease
MAVPSVTFSSSPEIALWMQQEANFNENSFALGAGRPPVDAVHSNLPDEAEAYGTNPGQLIVNRVATNSPAGRAGIPPGARLVPINGVPMEGSTIAQSVQLIRGAEGTQVILEYEDPQSGVRKQVALTREKVSWGLSN